MTNPLLRCARWVGSVCSEAARGLLELLLPGSCAACRREGPGPLCADCARRCRRPPGPACPACGARWSAGRCGRCRRFGRPWAFDGACALWVYAGTVRRLVQAFKYEGRRDVLRPLGRQLAADPRCAAAGGACLVVPVPARARSRRRRGYDQARELAQAYAEALGLPCEPRGLRRRRQGGPQAGRSIRRRRRQAAGAYRARRSCVAGEHVVLVDDVLSTGATADACARALRLGGALSVRVVALAT